MKIKKLLLRAVFIVLLALVLFQVEALRANAWVGPNPLSKGLEEIVYINDKGFIYSTTGFYEHGVYSDYNFSTLPDPTFTVIDRCLGVDVANKRIWFAVRTSTGGGSRNALVYLNIETKTWGGFLELNLASMLSAILVDGVVYYSNDTSIHRYLNNTWSIINSAGWKDSGGNLVFGAGFDKSIYIYENVSGVLYLRVWNGSSWVNFGSAGFATSDANNRKLMISKGVVYVVAKNGSGSVWSYNGVGTHYTVLGFFGASRYTVYTNPVDGSDEIYWFSRFFDTSGGTWTNIYTAGKLEHTNANQTSVYNHTNVSGADTKLWIYADSWGQAGSTQYGQFTNGLLPPSLVQYYIQQNTLELLEKMQTVSANALAAKDAASSASLYAQANYNVLYGAKGLPQTFDKAEASRIQAVSATTEATAAKTNANTAITRATEARDAVQSGATTTIGVLTDGTKGLTQTFDKAEAARLQATSAASEATAAKTNASTATTRATEARDAVKSGATTTIGVLTDGTKGLTQTFDKSEAARLQAVSATTEATAAKTNAATAITEATAAKTNASTAAARAWDATEGKSAATLAIESRQQALSAASEATAAKTNASTATTRATEARDAVKSGATTTIGVLTDGTKGLTQTFDKSEAARLQAVSATTEATAAKTNASTAAARAWDATEGKSAATLAIESRQQALSAASEATAAKTKATDNYTLLADGTKGLTQTFDKAEAARLQATSAASEATAAKTNASTATTRATEARDAVKSGATTTIGVLTDGTKGLTQTFDKSEAARLQAVSATTEATAAKTNASTAAARAWDATEGKSAATLAIESRQQALSATSEATAAKTNASTATTRATEARDAVKSGATTTIGVLTDGTKGLTHTFDKAEAARSQTIHGGKSAALWAAETKGQVDQVMAIIAADNIPPVLTARWQNGATITDELRKATIVATATDNSGSVTLYFSTNQGSTWTSFTSPHTITLPSTPKYQEVWVKAADSTGNETIEMMSIFVQ